MKKVVRGSCTKLAMRRDRGKAPGDQENGKGGFVKPLANNCCGRDLAPQPFKGH